METWKLLDGEVRVRDEGRAVWFRVDCKPPCELTRLLRCYCEGSNFLIGVLEPVNGRLTLERRVSRETLRQAGVTELPDQFYLSDGGAKRDLAEAEGIHTAEEVLEIGKEEPQVSGEAGTKHAEGEPLPSGAVAEPEKGKPQAAEVDAGHAKGEPQLPEAVIEPTVDSPQAAKAGAEPVQTVQPAEEAGAGSREGAPQPDGVRADASQQPPGGRPGQQKTGDALLDEVLARGEAYCEPSGQGLRISCPFSPVKPFPLAFIAPLCRVEHQLAVLDWDVPEE